MKNEKLESSPSSLQTLSAEMRELCARGEHAHGLTVIAWADQLDASAARQEERVQKLEAAYQQIMAKLEYMQPETFAHREAAPLRARVQELEREVARLTPERDGARMVARQMQERLEAAQSEMARQEEAIRQLKGYARHEKKCRGGHWLDADRSRNGNEFYIERDCTCGLDSLLTAEIRSLRETRQENEDEKNDAR